LEDWRTPINVVPADAGARPGRVSGGCRLVRRSVTLMKCKSTMGLAATLLLVTMIPACQSPRRAAPGGPGVVPYQAFRPPYYGETPNRPKFLRGYAGHNYGVAPHVEVGQ
jgi:hypothetical protein